jgi:hypothetical protein
MASSFFAWPKNEPKKASPLLALRVPCASQAVWNTTTTRYAQTLVVFYPNCFAMLGVAKGQK